MSHTTDLLKIAADINLMEIKTKTEAVKALEGMSAAERELMKVWPNKAFKSYSLEALKPFLKELTRIRKS